MCNSFFNSDPGTLTLATLDADVTQAINSHECNHGTCAAIPDAAQEVAAVLHERRSDLLGGVDELRELSAVLRLQLPEAVVLRSDQLVSSFDAHADFSLTEASDFERILAWLRHQRQLSEVSS